MQSSVVPVKNGDQQEGPRQKQGESAWMVVQQLHMVVCAVCVVSPNVQENQMTRTLYLLTVVTTMLAPVQVQGCGGRQSEQNNRASPLLVPFRRVGGNG